MGVPWFAFVTCMAAETGWRYKAVSLTESVRRVSFSPQLHVLCVNYFWFVGFAPIHLCIHALCIQQSLFSVCTLQILGHFRCFGLSSEMAWGMCSMGEHLNMAWKKRSLQCLGAQSLPMQGPLLHSMQCPPLIMASPLQCKPANEITLRKKKAKGLLKKRKRLNHQPRLLEPPQLVVLVRAHL